MAGLGTRIHLLEAEQDRGTESSPDTTGALSVKQEADSAKEGVPSPREACPWDRQLGKAQVPVIKSRMTAYPPLSQTTHTHTHAWLGARARGRPGQEAMGHAPPKQVL